MQLYYASGGEAPHEPTFQVLQSRFGPGLRTLEGGDIYVHGAFREDQFVAEGKTGMTAPDLPPMRIWYLLSCSAFIYLYYRGAEFLGAIGFHSPSGSPYLKGSGRRFEGPIEEARQAGFRTVQPGGVGVVLVAGSQTFHGYGSASRIREVAKEHYSLTLDLCKDEGVSGRQIIVYASSGAFTVTSDGRLGVPKSPRTVQAQGPAAAPKQKKHCYLTTAACTAMGLPDHCRELTLLRWFRDSILMTSHAGRRDVDEYYASAPRIVEAIDSRSDRLDLYALVFIEGVRPAADAIAAGDYGAAYRTYRAMHDGLRRRFLRA